MSDVLWSRKQGRFAPRAEVEREEQEARGPLGMSRAASDGSAATGSRAAQRGVSDLLSDIPVADLLSGDATRQRRTGRLPDLTVTAPAPNPIESSLSRATNPSLAAAWNRQNRPVVGGETSLGLAISNTLMQPFAAAADVPLRFGEGIARAVGAENVAGTLSNQRREVFEASQPLTTPAAITRIGSDIAASALPYVAAGAGAMSGGLRMLAPAVGRSAGLTAVESQAEGGSLVQGLADITGSAGLRQAAESGWRTPIDVGVDAALNLLPGAKPALAAFAFLPAPGRMAAASPLRSALETFSPKRTHTVKEWIDRIVDPKGNVKLRYSWTNPAGTTMQGTVAKDEAAILVNGLRRLGENETLSRDALIDFAEGNAVPLVEQARTDLRPRALEEARDNVQVALADWQDDAARGLDETGARTRLNRAITAYNDAVVNSQPTMYDKYISPPSSAGRVRESVETVYHEPDSPGAYKSQHWPRMQDETLPLFTGSYDDAVADGLITLDDVDGSPTFPTAFADQRELLPDGVTDVARNEPTGAYGTMHTRHTVRRAYGPDGTPVRRLQVEEEQPDVFNDIRDRGTGEAPEPPMLGPASGPSAPVSARPAVSEDTGNRIRTLRTLQQAVLDNVDEIAISGPAEQVRRYGTDRVVYTPGATDTVGTLQYTDETIGLDLSFTVDTTKPLAPQLEQQGFYELMRGKGKRAREFGPSGLESMARRFAKAIATPGEEVLLRADGMDAAYGVNGAVAARYAREAKKHLGLDLTFAEDGKGNVVARLDPEQRARAQAALEERRAEGRGFSLYSTPGMVGGGALVGGAAGAAAPAENENERAANIMAGMLAGAGVGGAVQTARTLARTLPTSGAMAQASQWIDFGGMRQRIADAAMRGGEVVEDYNWFDRVIERVAKSGHYLDRYGDQMAAGGLRPLHNPGILVNRTKASQHIVEQALMGDGLRNLQGEVITGKSLERVVKDTLGENPEDIRQGFAYLVAQRIKDRGPEAVGGNTQFYDDMVALADEGAATPQLQQFAQEWQGYMKGVMDYAVEAGLWTRSQADAFLASDALYVPLSRVVPEMERLRSAGRGAQFVNVDDGVYRMLGSQRVIRDPALASVEYVSRIIQRADHYRVGAALFDVAEKFGDDMAGIQRHFGAPPSGPVSGPGAFESLLQDTAGNDPFTNKLIWRNNPWTGEREFATITDGGLHQTLLTLNHQIMGSMPGVKKALDFVLGNSKRLLTAGTTGTPTFTVGTNITRDIGTAFSQTQAGMGLGQYARGFGAAITDGRVGGLPDLPEVRQAGLGGVSAYGAPRSPAAFQRAIAPTTRGQQARAAVGQAMASPLTAMEKIGEVSDLGPRAGEVIAAMEKHAGKVASGEWTPGDLRAYAAHLGRRTTIDFNDRGSWAGIQLLGAYIPFFSASMNGLATYALAVRRNPTRAAAVQGTLALAAALGWAMKQRLGEDAKAMENDRTAAERSTAIYFPVNDELTMKLPVPQEVGIGAHAVTAFLDGVMDKDPKAGTYLAESLYRMLPPVSPRSQPLVGAAWDVAKNERQFTGSPIEDMGMRGKLPEDRRRPETSPLYDTMAGAARMVPGWENASPMQAEHVTQRMLGTAPKSVLEAAYEGVTSGREPSPRVPMQGVRHPLNPARAVVAPRAPGATQSEVEMERLDKLYGQTERSYNATLGPDRQPTPTTEGFMQSGRGGILYGKPVFEAMRDSISVIRDERDRIVAGYRAGLYGGQYARTLLDQLAKREGAIYRSSQRDLNAVGIR